MTADPNYLMFGCVNDDPPDLRHVCLGMRLAMIFHSKLIHMGL